MGLVYHKLLFVFGSLILIEKREFQQIIIHYITNGQTFGSKKSESKIIYK